MKKEKLSFYYQHPLSINISLIFKSIFAKKKHNDRFKRRLTFPFLFLLIFIFTYLLNLHENTTNKNSLIATI